MPQPNLVPVRAASSRMAQSSGMSASTSSDTVLPLSLNSIIGSLPLPMWRHAPRGGGAQKISSEYHERRDGRPTPDGRIRYRGVDFLSGTLPGEIKIAASNFAALRPRAAPEQQLRAEQDDQ